MFSIHTPSNLPTLYDYSTLNGYEVRHLIKLIIKLSISCHVIHTLSDFDDASVQVDITQNDLSNILINDLKSIQKDYVFDDFDSSGVKFNYKIVLGIESIQISKLGVQQLREIFIHTPTYSQVSVANKTFSLSKKQSDIIKSLHAFYKQGFDGVTEEDISININAAGTKIIHAFRGKEGIKEQLIESLVNNKSKDKSKQTKRYRLKNLP